MANDATAANQKAIGQPAAHPGEPAQDRSERRVRRDATYDLRPPPAMLFLYLTPFVLVAVLRAHLLIRRRGARAARSGDGHRR